MPDEKNDPTLQARFLENLSDRPVRGRLIFRRVEPVLKLGALLLQMFPRSLCNVLLALVRHLPTRIGVGLRYTLLVRLCKRCGDCVALYEGAYMHGLSEVEIGDNVSIHPMVYIEGHGGLRIGNDVSIAHGTTLMTSSHDFSQPGVCTRDASVDGKSIIIGDDVWLGCGARVLAGVEIGEGAVVGAASVVTKSVPAFSVVAGVPAKVIRSNTKETPTPTKKTA